TLETAAPRDGTDPVGHHRDGIAAKPGTLGAVSGLLPAAREAAGSAGPVADAYWIKAALAAKAAGAPAGEAADFDTRQATDQDGEVAWLVRVAAAYRSIPEDSARRLLA
ncbi:DUF6545 domain-containing protein, partial [Streptomyces sp. Act-28]